jgi:hypothetical protein
MKYSQVIALANLLFWPVETLIAWGIWNGVIVRLFNAPNIAYWEMLLLLLFVGCLFPSSYSMYMGKILDFVSKEE